MSTSTEIFNPNENITVPKWINAEYFTDILIKDEPDFVSVNNCTVVAAIPPGENYTSVMLRIHLDLLLRGWFFIIMTLKFIPNSYNTTTSDQISTKRKTYVLKTMMDDDRGGDVINKLDLFPKELQMYDKYLPAFEELYRNVGWRVQFGPRCLFTETKDGRINFVFEDLSAKEFKNVNRLQGCDMKHMTEVLRRLAEFHAASAIYEERNGAYPKEFQVGFVEPDIGLEFQKDIFKAKEGAFKAAMQMWHMEDVDKYLQKFVICYAALNVQKS